MAITRRQFLKYAAASAAALGLSELELFQLTEKIMATPPAAPGAPKPKVIWLQGQACNGDAVSVVNIMNSIPPETVAGLKPTEGWQHTVKLGYGRGAEEFLGVDAAWGISPTTTIDDVLFDFLDLRYNPTLAGPAGALGYVEGVVNAATGTYLVIVEGSVPIQASQSASLVGASACKVGDRKGDGTGAAETLRTALEAIVPGAAAVIALGTCACYGGIPAAKNGNATYQYGPNKGNDKYRTSGAMSVAGALTGLTGCSGKPVVQIPGCPIRGDDLFLVVAQFILGGLSGLVAACAAETDPLVSNPMVKPNKILGINLFEETVHYHCSRKQSYANGTFATSFADTTGNKCLAMLGCKGPTTYGSCQRNKKHQWNPTTAGGATNPIHDTTPSNLWPATGTVPVYGGNLGTVSNDGGSSCIKTGHPCIGCKEKGFPDRFAPLVTY